jgi:hypothetical protein
MEQIPARGVGYAYLHAVPSASAGIKINSRQKFLFRRGIVPRARGKPAFRFVSLCKALKPRAYHSFYDSFTGFPILSDPLAPAGDEISVKFVF